MAQLSAEEQVRYGRHTILPEVGPEGQEKIKSAKVLCVGAGGLGSPLLTYLAAAGIGTIGIVDDDRVELSNIHRQPLHFSHDVGRPKVESAAEKLYAMNPNVRFRLYEERLNASNALEILNDFDIVADGTDNFSARYLVNDACVKLGKPNVHAAIFRFQGQLSVFDARRGPCYRCLFPEPPPPGAAPSCAEAGVLGVLPGVAGTLQATEVLKLVLGLDGLIGRLLTFDVVDMRFKDVRLPKDPHCPVCSAPRDDIQLIDYPDHCVANAAEPDLSDMTAEALRDVIESGGPRPVLVDVREPHEVVAMSLPYRHHIPLGSLPSRFNEIDRDADIVVYCRTGSRSAQAVKLLRAQGYPRVRNLAGGILAYMEAKAKIPI